MILVTGGTGYIGSHTVVELIEAGHELMILDNLSNSSSKVIERIDRITGKTPHFVEGDIRNTALLAELFAQNAIEGVIHFAGWKAVGESVAKPLDYYDNNIYGTLCLIQAMDAANVRTIVFSSSATVYGAPPSLPIREDFPLGATNPYGRTKLFIEEMLRDLAVSNPEWRIALLRYFNPVGAHHSGQIGENPRGVPNNLMPYIAQVATGRQAELRIFGNDYPTPDGTGIRDYIHVVDLAQGHIAALTTLQTKKGVLTVNLGTGRGYSVLEAVRAFEKACGKPIPYTIAPRRPGDIAACFADTCLAEQELNWVATRDIDTMCSDTWRWQRNNVDGY